MNTNRTESAQEAPLNNAQIAMNIVNGALLVSVNVVIVAAITNGAEALGLSNAVSNTILSLYGLGLMTSFNTIMKKMFHI